MDDRKVAQVTVLGRTYGLKIEPEKEEALKKAAEIINSQAAIYEKVTASHNQQDLLAMVALGQITRLIRIQETLNYRDRQLMDQLTEIDNTMENYLHSAQNSL